MSSTEAVSVPIGSSAGKPAIPVADGSGGGGFEFKPVAASEAPWTSDAAHKEAFTRWGLASTAGWATLRYTGRFDSHSWALFLRDLFNSAAFRDALPIQVGKEGKGRLSGVVESVECQALRASVMNMDWFQRFQDEEVVVGTGYIKKCMEERYDGAVVADLLKDSLINEDSEFESIFDDDEKEELLYRLFKSVVTGGGMCQYDDTWNDYLAVTKGLYKAMLTVGKGASGDMAILTKAASVGGISGADGDDLCLYPFDNQHNTCLVTVTPASHTVCILYLPFVPFW
jgi:hypothetical protein